MKSKSYPAGENSDIASTRPTMKTKGSWPMLRMELHQRILEGLSNNQLALHFAVSSRTIGNWKRTLKEELMAQENFDKFTWVSDQIETLKALRSEAYTRFLEATEARNSKEAYKWFEAAFKVQKALHDLFISSGALDDKPLSSDSIKS